MKRVLLDINVVLDVLLNRQPWVSDAAAIWAAQTQAKIDALLAAFSLSTIYYVIRRASDRANALAATDVSLSTLAIVPTELSTLRMARALLLADYEDCLQAASAIEAGAEALVTRDATGFVGAPIPVITAADYRAQLAQVSGP